MGLKILQQKLFVIILCAFLTMNYPLLMLASHEQLIFGIPTLTLYLFGLWAVLILIVRRLTSKLKHPENKTGTPKDDTQQ